MFKIIVKSKDPLCKYLAEMNTLFVIEKSIEEANSSIKTIFVMEKEYCHEYYNEVRKLIENIENRVIVYNAEVTNEDLLLFLFNAGVHGVVGKEHLFTEISKAINRIVSNDVSYPYEFLKSLFVQNKGQSFLTKKEIQVSRLLKSGQSYKEIAFLLGLSINTVKCYICSIYKKLNIHSKYELMNIQ